MGAFGCVSTSPESIPRSTSRLLFRRNRRCGMVVHPKESTVVRNRQESPGNETARPGFTRLPGHPGTMNSAGQEEALLLTLEEISQLVSHSHDPGETLTNIVRL